MFVKDINLKKIFCFLILIFSACFACGCAQINYTRYYTESGTVIDRVDISFDGNKFSQTQARNMYTIIQQDVLRYYDEIKEWEQDNFANKYVNETSVLDYFKKGITVTITNLETNNGNYEFGFNIQFATLEQYVYFYGLNTDEVLNKYGFAKLENVQPFATNDYGPFVSSLVSGDYRKERANLFNNSYIWQDNNIFQYFQQEQREDDQSYLDYYIVRSNDILGEEYTEDNVFDNITLKENFETSDARYKSNADGVYRDNEIGYVIHSWSLTSDDSQLEVYRVLPVQVWWYVLAVAITFVAIIIMFPIWHYRRERNVVQQ